MRDRERGMTRSTIWQRLGLAGLALTASAAASAQGKLGTIRFDNWGYFQDNTNDTYQWQYRPRVFVPWDFGNGWIATLRGDLPLLYTNNTGPAKRSGGYSGGVGNALVETIIDTPEVLPNLTLRASVRFVFQSPKGSPFGTGDQYQIAPGAGLTLRMPDVLRGVTVSPYLRWFRGFDPETPSPRLISSLNLFPAITFRLADRWSLAFYPENPIVYNFNNSKWFAPLDLLVIHRFSNRFEVGLGGAVKLGNPSAATYDYIINGRATLYF
jgi:hypothetical protein